MSLSIRINMVGTARVLGSLSIRQFHLSLFSIYTGRVYLVVQRCSVNIVVVGWAADDHDVSTGNEFVLAVDLLVTAVDGAGPGPDVDVVLTGLEVVCTLLAVIFVCCGCSSAAVLLRACKIRT